MKILFYISLLFLSSSLTSQTTQNDTFQRNELKINLPYLLFRLVDVTYERAINDESAYGISAIALLGEYANFKGGLTPYYRIYFGKKQLSGIFAEGSAACYLVGEKVNFNSIGLGFGFAIGIKSRAIFNNCVSEIYLGFGREFSDNNLSSFGVYPRIGALVGRKF